MEQPRKKIQAYDRHSILTITEVLPRIVVSDPRIKMTVKEEFNGQSVNVTSLRLQTFAQKGCTCKECGLEATHFAIERDLATAKRGGGYHLNLWGVKDGEEVLFTHDHILARALGGKDKLENTQTMCCYCNWEKGDLEKMEVDKRKEKK